MTAMIRDWASPGGLGEGRAVLLRHTLALYLIVDPDALMHPGRVLLAAASEGVSAIQIRMKNAHPRLIQRALRLAAHTGSSYGVPVLVNDSVVCARDPIVAGVHLGQLDTDPAWVRQQLGPHKIIGLSLATPQEAVEAVRWVAGGVVDYLSIGGIFESSTKRHQRPPQGLEGLRLMLDTVEASCAQLHQPPPPTIAISGITMDTIDAVMDTGVCGVAVSSAILGSADDRSDAQRVQQRTRLLRARIDERLGVSSSPHSPSDDSLSR